jgi:hypothetical protein
VATAAETVEQFAGTLAEVLRVSYGRITLHFEADKVVMITTETRHKPFEIAGLLSRRVAARSPGGRE